jgi:hypothetical protein
MDDNLTTFLVFAPDVQLGERVKQLLHGTGQPLLALDIVADRTQLETALRAWKPRVLVADARLELKADWGLPVVEYDDGAFDAEALAARILQHETDPPEMRDAPPPERPAHGVAVGFQGIKGGVGTTTVVAGMALAAARKGYRTAILDLSGDCALTLNARADEQDEHIFTSDEGILVIQGAADLPQVWQVLSEDYDVVVVDAGRDGEHATETRALTRLGVLFFLVVTAKEIELVHPGSYGRYRLFLNRQPDHRWWHLDLFAGIPDDPDLTERINRGKLASPSPFLEGMQAFTSRVLQREIV